MAIIASKTNVARIIVPQSIGQIGNRLEQFSHLIALNKATGVKIFNPSFSLYSEFFSGTCDDALCRYPAIHAGKPNRNIQRGSYWLIRFAMALRLLYCVPKSMWIDIHWSADAYDLGNPQFQRFLKDCRWIFLTGQWKHRYWSAYEQSIPIIREHFRLVPALEKKVKDHINRIRPMCDVLIGLHVRQGDNFTDPVRKDAFYSEDYARVARNISKLFPGRKVGFLLCTNTPQPRKLYSGLGIFDGPGDFILDMYSLAECDFIAGAAQSSFSGWASLMGQKPRYRIFDPEKTISIDDFSVCRGVED
jgi:hypothetical protein